MIYVKSLYKSWCSGKTEQQGRLPKSNLRILLTSLLVPDMNALTFVANQNSELHTATPEYTVRLSRF